MNDWVAQSEGFHPPPTCRTQYSWRTLRSCWTRLPFWPDQVLRDAIAVDTLDECGIYFGTTGGQVYASADEGDSWETIAGHLPAVLSVEVQTLS